MITNHADGSPSAKYKRARQDAERSSTSSANPLVSNVSSTSSSTATRQARGPARSSRCAQTSECNVLMMQPEWLRLPRTGEREPLTGLSRSTLNELILANAANNWQPPVYSKVLKKPHAVRGIRLVHRPSLFAYLDRIADEANSAPPPAERDGLNHV